MYMEAMADIILFLYIGLNIYQFIKQVICIFPKTKTPQT
ncbi:MAG: hypothetical protein E7035_02270 [Verrucomicrobiaceae bacterium]|nr:hypothetical protein [Verrucomicrobiaceae bacterium]